MFAHYSGVSTRFQGKKALAGRSRLEEYRTYGRKEPFRSVPISAKTPAELALLMVKVTPFCTTVKDPVAVAKRISAAKFEGSVGSGDPGRKW